MEQLQQIWKQTRELYRKLPEIVRFVLETLGLLTVWTASTKIIGLVYSQFEKIKLIQQVEAHLDKVIIYTVRAYSRIIPASSQSYRRTN